MLTFAQHWYVKIDLMCCVVFLGKNRFFILNIFTDISDESSDSQNIILSSRTIRSRRVLPCCIFPFRYTHPTINTTRPSISVSAAIHGAPPEPNAPTHSLRPSCPSPRLRPPPRRRRCPRRPPPPRPGRPGGPTGCPCCWPPTGRRAWRPGR